MSPERQHSVTVVDVSPRDGLQIEPYLMPTPEKVELVRRLTLAGLRRIEVTSFVNPARVPQMADAESLLDALRDLQGVSLSALVLNERGFERALGSGLHEVTYVVPATDAMAQRNQGADAATVLAGWRAVASRAGEAASRDLLAHSAQRRRCRFRQGDHAGRHKPAARRHMGHVA